MVSAFSMHSTAYRHASVQTHTQASDASSSRRAAAVHARTEQAVEICSLTYLYLMYVIASLVSQEISVKCLKLVLISHVAMVVYVCLLEYLSLASALLPSLVASVS